MKVSNSKFKIQSSKCKIYLSFNTEGKNNFKKKSARFCLVKIVL